MYCKNLKKKMPNLKNKSTKFECKLTGNEITLLSCQDCLNRNVVKNKPIRIKNKTDKLKKLEKNRFSILTDNLFVCYICGRPKDDLNEVYGGSNRQKSMQWGCIIPLCRRCHTIWHTDKELRQKYYDVCRNKFVELYGFDKFMEEFKKSYKED